MKNNLVLLIVFCFCSFLQAQNNLDVRLWGKNYTPVSTYNGERTPAALTLVVDGTGNINVSNWRLSVSIKNTLTSSNGTTTLPTNKISLQPESVIVQANPNNTPTLAQIGALSSVSFPDSNVEMDVVPKSNAPFLNQSDFNAYYSFQMTFALSVAPGAYLGTLGSYSQFDPVFEFKLYDGNNRLIASRQQQYKIQIMEIKGTPPLENILSLTIEKTAKSGQLNLSTLAHYTKGTSVTYANAVTVRSTTDYRLTVKSTQPTFRSNNGNNIPLNSISVGLKPNAGTKNSSVSDVWLSTSPQTIAMGKSLGTNSAIFDLTYATKPADNNLISAKMEDYSTSLIYEITAQ